MKLTLWLAEISRKNGDAFEEIHLFFSHVIYCACASFDPDPLGQYRGLSTDIADHHHPWLPESEWLQESDIAILLTLKTWFAQNAAKMAIECLELVNDDLTKSAYAMEGFATLQGSEKVARAIHLFADRETQPNIMREIGFFDDVDAGVVAALIPQICDRNSKIVDFLTRFPRQPNIPDGP